MEQKKKLQEKIAHYQNLVNNIKMSLWERKFYLECIEESRKKWNDFVGL